MDAVATEFEQPENIRSLAMIRSRTVVGVSALPVMVEVHLANGLPSFSTVGLPEAAVKESKDRVRGAIINSGFEFPAKRITVNLAPADIPKAGGRFDLPIAIGILIASGQLPAVNTDSFEMIGELALNGRLRQVSGVLPTALACGEASRELIVPSANSTEAALVKEALSWQGDHLLKVCKHLAGKGDMQICKPDLRRREAAIKYPDLVEVKGQERAKRALEIAATGGHSLLFIGPPGTGKSMLAERLPGILPALTPSESLQTAAIHSVAHAGLNVDSWRQRPFRNPHHSASAVALVGGGSNPRPGEISLAHNGILFLDELTEFSRSALEQLREPLETGQINIARASQSVQYPASFQLITACNPCKCGFLGDGTDRCKCSPTSIEAYRAKLSGPMLDRIDMHVHLPRVDLKTLQKDTRGAERSFVVKQRVTKTRELQLSKRGLFNSQLSGLELEKFCGLDDALLDFLAAACEKLNMSARAYHRVLKLARTIADIESQDNIGKKQLLEAISYRSLDRG